MLATFIGNVRPAGLMESGLVPAGNVRGDNGALDCSAILPSCPHTTVDTPQQITSSLLVFSEPRAAGQARGESRKAYATSQSSTRGQHSWADTPVPEQDTRSAHSAMASDLAQGASWGKQLWLATVR